MFLGCVTTTCRQTDPQSCSGDLKFSGLNKRFYSPQKPHCNCPTTVGLGGINAVGRPFRVRIRSQSPGEEKSHVPTWNGILGYAIITLHCHYNFQKKLYILPETFIHSSQGYWERIDCVFYRKNAAHKEMNKQVPRLQVRSFHWSF